MMQSSLPHQLALAAEEDAPAELLQALLDRGFDPQKASAAEAGR
jgi:hypothetical protein